MDNGEVGNIIQKVMIYIRLEVIVPDYYFAFLGSRPGKSSKIPQVFKLLIQLYGEDRKHLV